MEVCNEESNTYMFHYGMYFFWMWKGGLGAEHRPKVGIQAGFHGRRA